MEEKCLDRVTLRYKIWDRGICDIGFGMQVICIHFHFIFIHILGPGKTRDENEGKGRLSFWALGPGDLGPRPQKMKSRGVLH